MSDEECAALAGNTSHLGQGPPQYNRPPSLPHREPFGKALHRRHAQEESDQDGAEERPEHPQCCSKERYLGLCLVKADCDNHRQRFGGNRTIKYLRNDLEWDKAASDFKRQMCD